MADSRLRCRWAMEHPELIDYHDNVWGVPTRNDREIFAAYAQCVMHAGLLWTAMLKKRPVFQAAFSDWDIKTVATYNGVDMERLMTTEGMIRNFVKVNSVINNARKFLEIQSEFGSFASYIWRFTNNETLIQDVTGRLGRPEAEQLAVDLKRRGFKFSGPATAYGLMQDIGMVNDHSSSCYRVTELVR